MFNVLHVHSMFSIGDSAASPEDIVCRAKELAKEVGETQVNLTLTDHRTLLGVVPFMEAGVRHGVNTIPGIEAEVRLPEDFLPLSEGKLVRNHLILLPKDQEGFLAISKAAKEASRNPEIIRGNAYPVMDDDMLRRYFANNFHVIATSACIMGPIAWILRGTLRSKAAKEQRKQYQEDHDTYQGAKKRLAAVKEEIKALKKEKTLVSAPLKKPFQEKIKRLQNRPEKAVELALAQITVQQAEEKTAQTIKQIEEKTAEKQHLEEVCKFSESGYKKYVKFQVPEYKESALYELAKERLLILKDIFPNFFIELQYHGLEDESYVMPILLRLADETHTPIIAANDAHMVINSEKELEARRIVRFNLLHKSASISDCDKQLYLKSNEELVAALSQVIPSDRAEEAIAHTNVLAECHVTLPAGSHYPKVKGESQFLQKIKEAKQAQIEAGHWSDKKEERLQHEISVIQTMGYEDYHMIVELFCRIGRLMGQVPRERRKEVPEHFADLEEWVKEVGNPNGIGIGIGRGSAVGSLVCYLLGITGIDPMQHDLLFERFLNPERASMPDIDTDIATSIRPYLISWLRWYFGENAVCSIAAITTYKAKAALGLAGRDLADQIFSSPASVLSSDFASWVHDLPQGLRFSEQQKLLKQRYLKDVVYQTSDLLPDDNDATLDVLRNHPILQSHPEMKRLWEQATLIEGCVSSVSVHAGGVIIADQNDVGQYVPLAWNTEKNVWVASCNMLEAERMGLLKMDLLGLSTLDIMNRCLDLIRQHQGLSIDLSSIPFEDEVFSDIYSAGRTASVFQVESSGMTQMLKRFVPSCFSDLILLIAAYRPGPIQFLDDIIEVKHGRKKMTFLHPALESILSDTYGAIIYQEQVMQIFQKLAGYSLGGADLVRRAMSKKKESALKAEREAFIFGDPKRNISGCVANGVDEETASTIFDQMMAFSHYAFNKSHAAAYAFLSYQTAWLKYHYPTEFFCACFDLEPQEKYPTLAAELSTYQIPLLHPDINESTFSFRVAKGQIRFGFLGIKGLGEKTEEVIRAVVKERGEHGTFLSIADFLTRTAYGKDGTVHLLSTDFLRTLSESGCFDSLYRNREALTDYFVSVGGRTFSDFSAIELPELIPDVAFPKAKSLVKDAEYLKTVLWDAHLPVKTEPGFVIGILSNVTNGVTKKGQEKVTLQVVTQAGIRTVLFTGKRLIAGQAAARLLGQPVAVAVSSSESHDLFFGVRVTKFRDRIPLYTADTEDPNFFAQILTQKKEKITGEPTEARLVWSLLRKDEKPVIECFSCSLRLVKELQAEKVRVTSTE